MRHLLIITALFLIVSCAQEPADPIGDALRKDLELTETLLDDADTNSSTDEHLEILGRNFQARLKIIKTLEAFRATEKTVLHKQQAIEFLTLENSYCEGAADWHIRRHEADRIEARSRGNFPPEYPPLRQASRNLSATRQRIVASEHALIPIGWKARWGDKSWRKPANIASKPEILDDSQWRFIQSNKLTEFAETQRLLIWYRTRDVEGAKRVQVAAIVKNNLTPAERHQRGNWLWISEPTFYCRERLMTESGNKKMMESSTFTEPDADYTTPKPIQHSEKVDSLLSTACK